MFKNFRHSRTALVGVCCALVGAAVVPVLSLAGSISGSTGDGPMVLQSGQAASLTYEGRLNVSSAVATPEPATWSRVGDTVQQSGVIAVTPAAAGTNTQVYIPTVVDSNVNGSGCSGNATVTAPSAAFSARPSPATPISASSSTRRPARPCSTSTTRCSTA
jgi:hypothetical protein